MNIKKCRHLVFIFGKIWKAEVVDHVPGPHQHAQPVLLQQLEKVPMGSIPHKLGQLVVVAIACLSHADVTVTTKKVEAVDPAAATAEEQQQQQQQRVHGCHVPLGSGPPAKSSEFYKKQKKGQCHESDLLCG